LFEADLKSANGAVNAKLLGDIGEFGPLPTLESAVQVHASDAADLAVTLDRGILVLTNAKKEGPAKAAVTVRGVTIAVTLKTPGTKIGFEVYGRHSGGGASILKDEPTTFFIAIVGAGSAELASKEHRFALAAPPGPAVFRWDSVTREPEIVNLDKFPPELIRSDKEKARFAELCQAAASLGTDRAKGLQGLLDSTSSDQRRAGVTALGALDDLPHLLQALANEKHQDVREQAILTLRHWLGRAPGQVKTLRVAMLKSKQFSLLQVKTTMQLLFGFDDEDRARPAVKELLAVLLDHKNVGIRELAHWHLVRIEPKGRDIPYDAAGSADQRQQAIERWRQVLQTASAPVEDNKK